MLNKARIVTIDIETSPLVSYTWGTFEQDVGIEQIKDEWTILSFAAKWFEDNEVIYYYTGGRGKQRVRDDKQLLLKLHQILDGADIVIAQNGKRFDLKKINARMVMLGIAPYSPVRVIDTLEVAKRHFAFTSNRLAWTSKHLTSTPKSEHKQFPGFELWLECLADNPKAWAEMKKYNIQDVRATEEVYKRLRPWITSHPNMGMYIEHEGQVCPKCGGQHLNARGFQLTNSAKYQRYRCMDCGGWSRSKYILTSTTKRKQSLVSL